METMHETKAGFDVESIEPPPPGSCGEDVALSWEDIWVTVSNGRKGSKAILQGVTGYAQPGQMLAIMGPSGCGKSTLLDTLAGRLSTRTRQTGDILINGHKQRLTYGTSAYVTQEDTLITTLTVREAVNYSAGLQLPDSMSKSEKRERAEMTIKEMGLQDAIDTRIGGWGVKGLSGGQKRRVSICIEILKRPKLVFLDEPTSGLDSAASYYVMRRISNLDQNDGIRRTIIASIHQPSSEVFQLFNYLCLLSSGQVVYFGPASAANQFFASNGFPCPNLQNPSDHFLKTINKDFEKDLEEGLGVGGMSTEQAISTLIKSYISSENYVQIRKRVAEISKQEYGGSEKKRKGARLISQCVILTRRSFVNMYRDLGYYWLRLVIYVALAIGIATLFPNLGFTYNSIQDRGSLMMYIASFLTFMTIGGFPSFVEDMKVFEAERLNGHYGATTFLIGNTISGIPYLVLISLIPGAISYYFTGLQKGADHFLYFTLCLFGCMMLVESIMMVVASIVPNFLMGIITGAGIQAFMILGGGFFRLPNHMPLPFWKYPMYYVSFHRYAYQGMFKNEFYGLFFPNNQAGGPLITGEYILKNVWQVELGYSKWADLGILFGMVFIYRLLFLVVIKIKDKVKPFMIGVFASLPPKQTTQVIETI